MYPNFKKENKNQNKNLEIFYKATDCKVSIASIEIMLNRFCNGQEIDFPFHNN